MSSSSIRFADSDALSILHYSGQPFYIFVEDLASSFHVLALCLISKVHLDSKSNSFLWKTANDHPDHPSGRTSFIPPLPTVTTTTPPEQRSFPQCVRVGRTPRRTRSRIRLTCQEHIHKNKREQHRSNQTFVFPTNFCRDTSEPEEKSQKIEITSRERVGVCHRSHAVSSCQFCLSQS